MNGELTDEMLMLRYKDGDADAFDNLFARHNGGVYRYFLRQGQAAPHAEELAQDVWTNVIRAAPNYEVAAKFNTWLYRIAHNRLIDHVRSASARPEDCLDELPEAADAFPIPEFQIPERVNERRQMAEHMLQVIAELPPDQAEVFLLHEESELTLEQIAAAIGVGRETAKSRLRYALNKLRTALSEWR